LNFTNGLFANIGTIKSSFLFEAEQETIWKRVACYPLKCYCLASIPRCKI